MDLRDEQGIRPAPDAAPYPRGLLPGPDSLHPPEGIRPQPGDPAAAWEVPAAGPYNPQFHDEGMSPAAARGCFLAVLALALALPITLYAFVLIAWSSR